LLRAAGCFQHRAKRSKKVFWFFFLKKNFLLSLLEKSFYPQITQIELKAPVFTHTSRHCERSEAIRLSFFRLNQKMDCFASLAMTAGGSL